MKKRDSFIHSQLSQSDLAEDRFLKWKE